MKDITKSIISITVLTFFLLSVLYLFMLDVKHMNAFCRENGFEESDGDNYCISYKEISSKKVYCKGLIKLECRWVIDKKVVEVGE